MTNMETHMHRTHPRPLAARVDYQDTLRQASANKQTHISLQDASVRGRSLITVSLRMLVEIDHNDRLCLSTCGKFTVCPAWPGLAWPGLAWPS